MHFTFLIDLDREYMGGGTLRDFLDKRYVCTPEARYNIAVSVCEGMDYLHNESPPIIHRDLTRYVIVWIAI